MKRKIIIFAGIVLAFLLLSYGFVPQVLGGKIVNQSDISGFIGMSHEMSEWNKANPGNETVWTGAMFGGMPTTTIHCDTKGDLTQPLYNLLLTGRRPATYLFIALLGAFLLLLSLGVSPFIAAAGAIAVAFCSYNLQIIQVGHNTKMQAIAFMPWVLSGVIFTYRAKKFAHVALGAVLFGLALSFQIKANHPQISYYLALMILVYTIGLFIAVLRSKKGIKEFFIASAMLLATGLTGIGTNATKLLPTWEYTKHSMRGGASNGSTKGLEMSYATAWSYGWEELPNLLVPDFNGGASASPLGPSSETYKLLKRAGQPNLRETCKALPTYWGPQPFTAGPMYMGAVSVFLFILGLCLLGGLEKWWLAAASLLAVLLSLGSNFQWFTTLFYRFAPLYNKFRTVSMALVVLQVALPALGFLVLDRILKGTSAADFRRKGWIALAITGGFCLLCTLFPGIAGSFSSAYDASYPDALRDTLASDRRQMLRSDALRSLILIAATYVVCLWATGKKAARLKNGSAVAAALVAVLLVADLFPVGKRYLNSDHFVTPKAFHGQFDKRPVDEIILEDTDPSYRVLDLTVNVFNDSHPSYWHKNIGGYSPAKLQLYQEYIDSHLAPEMQELSKALSGAATLADAEAALPELEGLSKLNCRYIIVSGELPPLRYRHAKGNAWFEGEGEIEMTSYAPNELRYRCSSPEGGKAVFSEVFYPNGWTATLEDGTTLPIYLTDEVLRGIDLPAGEHTVVMRFDPVSYKTGSTVSLACSILLMLLLLGSLAGLKFLKD